MNYHRFCTGDIGMCVLGRACESAVSGPAIPFHWPVKMGTDL